MTRRMVTQRQTLWLMIALLLLTFWLGARGLNADVIWRDEHHSLEDSGMRYMGPFTPLGVWRQVAERNPWHAPGYFIALNLWARAVGGDPAALRAMSLLLGVLTVALTYHIGQRVAGERVGLYAAVLIGTSAFFAHFLHEMRVYALMAFLTVVTVALYWHIMRGRQAPPLAMWPLFIASAAGLFYSHYFAAIPLALLGLHHLLFVPRSRRWVWMLGAMVLSALLFLPWAAVLARAMQLVAARENLQSEALTAGAAIEALAFQFGNGLTPLLAVVGIAALAYRGRWRGFILLMAVGSTALLLAMNSVVEVMHAGRLRYLLGLWPLLALAFALGIAAMRRWSRLLSVGVLAVWAVAGIFHALQGDLAPDLDGANYVFPFHRVAQTVAPAWRSGDVAINYVPDDGVRAGLYEPIAAYYFAPINLEYLILQTPDAATWQAQQVETLRLLDDRDRLWLATMPDRESAHLGALISSLEVDFVACSPLRNDRQLRLRQYARDASLCAP